ncbi:MAG: NfeD family protein [Pseudomonadota bacterium]
MEAFEEILRGLGSWVWFIVALLLMLMEAVVPGVYFIWFGAAAVVVGFLTLVVDMSWQVELLLFALLALSTVFVVRRFLQPAGAVSDEPTLNVRGQQYVGRTVVVTQAIVAGRGRVKVGDTLWTAEGPDTPEGASVRVTGANGTALTVEAV